MIYKALKKAKTMLYDKRILDKKNSFETYANQSSDNTNIINGLLKNIQYVSNDNIKVQNEVYRDTEFFDTFAEKGKTVFNLIEENFTLEGTKTVGKDILNCPSDNIELLQKRQGILKNITGIDTNPDTHKDFEQLKKTENDILWLFSLKEKNLEDLLNIVYFKYLPTLNDSSHTLTAYNFYRIVMSPIFGIFTPIIFYIIPFFIVILKFKIKISFTNYVRFLVNSLMSSFGTNSKLQWIHKVSMILSAFFYFQGIFNSIELSRTLQKINSHIIEKFNGVVTFLKCSQNIISKYWTKDIVGSFIESKNIINDEEEFKYIDNLTKIEFSLLKNFGKQLTDYKNVNKDIIQSVLYKIYVLDFLRGTLKFKNSQNMCFTEFTISDTPIINIQGIRHPNIDQDVVIKNDFIYNGKNIIITGPNAGGKSTFIKSLLINLLLSETVTISAADTCTLTPFNEISSQINVPDTKGYESLFEAEMHRCQKNLESLKKKQGGFSFVVMDEIFNSTNPLEGISAAYAIAKKISEYPFCVLVFTTHYIYLTKLGKRTSRFENKKMEVKIENDKIQFLYKLKPGFSKQYIALELLKDNGFDNSVIEEALEIKRTLLCV